MLTFEFVPYFEMMGLSSAERIKRLLSIVKANKIVLLEGRLKKDEETTLIQRTMEEIDTQFRGIELGVIYPDKRNKDFFHTLRKMVVKLVLGNREGFTIIGPATIIKDIKRDPNKLQLFTAEVNGEVVKDKPSEKPKGNKKKASKKKK